VTGSRTFERGEINLDPTCHQRQYQVYFPTLGIVSTRVFILSCTDTIYNTVSGSTSNGIIVSGAGCEKNERIEGQRAVRIQ
jgi:hypothetical protein